MEFPQEVWNVDTNQGGWLLVFMIGTFIMPLVQWLKQMRIPEFVRPEFLTAVFSVVAGFGINSLMETGLTPGEVTEEAFKSIGAATVTFGLYKVAKTATKK